MAIIQSFTSQLLHRLKASFPRLPGPCPVIPGRLEESLSPSSPYAQGPKLDVWLLLPLKVPTSLFPGSRPITGKFAGQHNCIRPPAQQALMQQAQVCWVSGWLLLCIWECQHSRRRGVNEGHHVRFVPRLFFEEYSLTIPGLSP